MGSFARKTASSWGPSGRVLSNAARETLPDRVLAAPGRGARYRAECRDRLETRDDPGRSFASCAIRAMTLAGAQRDAQLNFAGLLALETRLVDELRRGSVLRTPVPWPGVAGPTHAARGLPPAYRATIE